MEVGFERSFVPNILFVTIVPLALLTSTAYSRHAEFGRYLAYENSLKLARRVCFKIMFHIMFHFAVQNSFDSLLLHVLSTKRGTVFCLNSCMFHPLNRSAQLIGQ